MPTLEQKIRKHNPSLQELTFGCKLYRPEWGYATINDVQGTGNGAVMKYFSNRGHVFYSETIKYGKIRRNSFDVNEYWDIIGHPIELRHVLIAIEKSENKVILDSKGRMVIKDQLYYAQKHGVFKSHQIAVDIDLSLPFSQQSPEVHEFINKLID